MSDGPHRSLPMRRPWKTVAECADTPAFEVDEIREVILPALEQDCRREMRRAFLDDLCRACSDQEGSLFKSDVRPSLEALRRDAGSGMERLVLDHAMQVASNGNTGLDIAEKGMTQALKDRGTRGTRQVEEHYLRKSTEWRAHNVRGRMEQALNGADMASVARRVLQGKEQKDAARPRKRQGLDDGVKL
jgi:hypothetical protein